MRASACPQKTPNLRGGFRKRRLTNIPRRHRLADGQLSSLYAPLPSLSSSPLWWCAIRLVLPLWAHPLCYPRIELVVNIICIRRMCDHINVLHIFDQTCTVLNLTCFLFVWIETDRVRAEINLFWVWWSIDLVLAWMMVEIGSVFRCGPQIAWF